MCVFVHLKSIKVYICWGSIYTLSYKKAKPNSKTKIPVTCIKTATVPFCGVAGAGCECMMCVSLFITVPF